MKCFVGVLWQCRKFYLQTGVCVQARKPQLAAKTLVRMNQRQENFLPVFSHPQLIRPVVLLLRHFFGPFHEARLADSRPILQGEINPAVEVDFCTTFSAQVLDWFVHCRFSPLNFSIPNHIFRNCEHAIAGPISLYPFLPSASDQAILTLRVDHLPLGQITSSFTNSNPPSIGDTSFQEVNAHAASGEAQDFTRR